MNKNTALTTLTALTIILSGGLFYFSTGFNQCWPLLWFAPIPILIYSYRNNFLLTLLTSFLAFFIGKLNTLAYLTTAMPVILVISPIIFQSVVFCIIILINRFLIKKSKHWLSIFYFPALFSIYEFLFSLVSAGGALASLSYNELHFLPFIQIVSITGIWGATFILLLFSSGISYALYTKNKPYKITALSISILIPLICICYGYNRLTATHPNKNKVTIGLVSINTPRLIHGKQSVNFSKKYLPLIQEASNRGAKYIVLPEKFITVNNDQLKELINPFESVAKKNKITLILGVGLISGNTSTNSAIIISQAGKIIGKYNKHHLLPGLEDQFMPGKKFYTKDDQFKWGVGICKDMDFSSFGKYYGKTRTQLLLVPALDFNVDAWYHGRSAIMRGIENGFAVARTGAHGYLSISNQFGKIITLQPDFHQENNVVVSSVTLYSIHTTYSSWGNWFMWLVLIFLVIGIIITISKR